MSRRPTVVEVADRAGVSIASVSRVLNGKPARRDTEDRVRRPSRSWATFPTRRVGP